MKLSGEDADANQNIHDQYEDAVVHFRKPTNFLQEKLPKKFYNESCFNFGTANPLIQDESQYTVKELKQSIEKLRISNEALGNYTKEVECEGKEINLHGKASTDFKNLLTNIKVSNEKFEWPVEYLNCTSKELTFQTHIGSISESDKSQILSEDHLGLSTQKELTCPRGNFEITNGIKDPTKHHTEIRSEDSFKITEEKEVADEAGAKSNMANVMDLIKSKYLSKCRVESSYGKSVGKEKKEENLYDKSNIAPKSFIPSKLNISSILKPNSESQRFLDLLELASGKKPASGHSFLKDRIYSLTKRATRSKYHSHHGGHFGGLGVKNVVKKVETKYKDAKKEITEKRFNAKTQLNSPNSSCSLTPTSTVSRNLDKATEVKRRKPDDPFLESNVSRFSLKSVALSIIQKLKESGNDKLAKSIKKPRRETPLTSDLVFDEYFNSPEAPKSPPFVPCIFRGTGTFVVTGSRGMIYDFNDHDNVFEEYIKSFDGPEFHSEKAESQPISPVLRRKNSKKTTKSKLLSENVSSPTISFYFDFQEPIISDRIPPECKVTNFGSFENDELANNQMESMESLNSKNPKNQKNFVSSKSLSFSYSNTSSPSSISKYQKGNSNEDISKCTEMTVVSLNSPAQHTVEPKIVELAEKESSQILSKIFESKFYRRIGSSSHDECVSLSPSMCIDMETCSDSEKKGDLIDDNIIKKAYYLHKFASQSEKCDKVPHLKAPKNYSSLQSQQSFVKANVDIRTAKTATKPILKSILRKPPHITTNGANTFEKLQLDTKIDSINLLSPTKLGKKENYTKTSKVKMNRNKKAKVHLKSNMTNSNNKINKGYDFSGFIAHFDNKVKNSEKSHNYKNTFSFDKTATFSSTAQCFNRDEAQSIAQSKVNFISENEFNKKETKNKRDDNLSKALNELIKEVEPRDSNNLHLKDQLLREHLDEQITKNSENTDSNIPDPPKLQVPEKKEHKEVGKLLAEINDLVCRISSAKEVNAGSDLSKYQSDNPKRYSARFSNAFTEKFLSSNVEFRKSQLSKNSQSLPVIASKCENSEDQEGVKSCNSILRAFKINDKSVKVTLHNPTSNQIPFAREVDQINEGSFPSASNHLAESRQGGSLKIGRAKNSQITYSPNNAESILNIIPETVQKQNFFCDSVSAGKNCSATKLPRNETVTCSATLGRSKSLIFKSTAEFVLRSSMDSKIKLESIGKEKFPLSKVNGTIKSALSEDEIPKVEKDDSKSSKTDDGHKCSYKQTLMEIQKLMPTRERNIPIQGGHVESKANDYLKAVQKSFGTTANNDIQLLKKANKSKILPKHQSNLVTDSIPNHHELKSDRKMVFRTTKYLAPLNYQNGINETYWYPSLDDLELKSAASSVNRTKLLYVHKTTENVKNDERFYDKYATYSETQTPQDANIRLDNIDLLVHMEKDNYVSNNGKLGSHKVETETEKRNCDEVSSKEVQDLKRPCYENQNKNETAEKLPDVVEEISSNHHNSDVKEDQQGSIVFEVEKCSNDDEQMRNAALVDAVLKNNVSLVRKFLSLKADPNTKCGSAGGTVLHKAASRCYFEILQELLLAGANIESRTGYGNTPLHFAAEKGHANIVSELLSRGANVNATTSYGITPLQLSLALGYLDINIILMEHQADFFQPNIVGETSEYIADSLGYDSEYLQSILYNPSFKETEPSEVPLSVQLIRGVEEGCPLTVENCLKNGANPDTPVPLALHWPGQATVLHRAAHKGDDLLIQLLLRAGSSVNSRDIVGNTPLHAGAQRGCNRVVKLLIESGSDLEATSRKGMTPLHRAASKGKDHTVRLLLKYGASYLAIDEYGRTPSDWAHKRGFKTLAKHLQLQSQSGVESLINTRKNPLVDSHYHIKKISSKNDTAIK